MDLDDHNTTSDADSGYTSDEADYVGVAPAIVPAIRLAMKQAAQDNNYLEQMAWAAPEDSSRKEKLTYARETLLLQARICTRGNKEGLAPG